MQLFKALKRAFSWFVLKNETTYATSIGKLIRFFNGESGLLYHLKSDVEVLQEVTTKRLSVPPNIVKANIDKIVKRFPDRAIFDAIKEHIEHKQFDDAINAISKIVNEQCYSFINENHDVI